MLRYIGPLPGGGDVKVDVTLREHVAFPLANRPVLRGYEEFIDVLEGHMLQVYSLDEIAAEKTIALADKAQNEPRELYDLWYLTRDAGIHLEPLIAAIESKLEFRGVAFEGLIDAIMAKEARLKRLWVGRMANQMAELPPFDDVFPVVRRALRQTEWT